MLSRPYFTGFSTLDQLFFQTLVHGFLVVVAIVSDRLRLRGVIMLFTLPIAIIDSPRVQFGMTILMASG